jgi:hypothetical protein
MPANRRRATAVDSAGIERFHLPEGKTWKDCQMGHVVFGVQGRDFR